MEKSLFRELRQQRPQIRERWEAFLRIERVKTPLANPDTLVYLLDDTLDQVFKLLSASNLPPLPHLRSCTCGRHPLLAYFRAGEQALMEALILTQAESSKLTPAQRDGAVTKLKHVLRVIIAQEIESFAGIFCQRESC